MALSFSDIKTVNKFEFLASRKGAFIDKLVRNEIKIKLIVSQLFELVR